MLCEFLLIFKVINQQDCSFRGSSMKKRQKKRTLSAVALSSAMLLNVVLPQSAILAHAETNTVPNNSSSDKFTADEVNRILSGLTPEQKAIINKLTGTDNTQKIRVERS